MAPFVSSPSAPRSVTSGRCQVVMLAQHVCELGSWHRPHLTGLGGPGEVNICRLRAASEVTVGQDRRLPSSPRCPSTWHRDGTQYLLCNDFFLQMRKLSLKKVTCCSRAPSLSSPQAGVTLGPSAPSSTPCPHLIPFSEVLTSSSPQKPGRAGLHPRGAWPIRTDGGLGALGRALETSTAILLLLDWPCPRGTLARAWQGRVCSWRGGAHPPGLCGPCSPHHCPPSLLVRCLVLFFLFF